MDVLGFSCNYHDSAACLVRDGIPVAAAEEERFTRIKHDAQFPSNAIKYCLEEGGISPAKLSCVVFYEKPIRKLERIFSVGASNMPRAAPSIVGRLNQVIDNGLLISEQIRDNLRFDGDIYYAEHHLSHAASAFFCSRFSRAAVLTVDGVGEWATTAQFLGRDSNIFKLREIHYPNSLGLLYSALTVFLGFKANDDEYKIMGLAPYGRPTALNALHNLISINDDGSFALNMEYFSYHHSDEEMFSSKLVNLLGPPRRPGERLECRHADIASSAQHLLEEAMLALAKSVQATSNEENLCLAGGVAYNCSANARVSKDSGFRRVFVQPAAGDSGAALGAALWAYHQVLGGVRRARDHSTLLGPKYPSSEIIRTLRRFRLPFEELTEPAICREASRLIHENFVLAWFQGRMEFGPRALGARSILANPGNPEMKDILNRRIKFREEFRPFAPVVLEDVANTYFEMPAKSPFMLFTYKVRKKWASRLPAITHIDSSARVQTIARSQNPLFYALVSAFGKLSGIPVLINTSFNVKGEPIVCTPRDAVRCFLSTDIDFLVIGRCIVRKQ